MATFNPRRISDPTTLREISPEHLQAFLAPYRTFLSARGLDMSASLFQEVDYEHLSRILMEPDTDTPKDLIEALCYINVLAHPDGMDALLRAAESAQIRIADNSTPADVALQVWLADRNLLMRIHAESAITRRRSFKYFQTELPAVPHYQPPTDDTLELMGHHLDIWFIEKKRGAGVRVFKVGEDNPAWFLIRHGDPFTCNGSLEGTQTASVSYRPLKYDVVGYDPVSGELRINARSKAEKDLYRTLFGMYLFSNERFFPATPTQSKFTLQPLRDLGRDALYCKDIPGLERVTLTTLLEQRCGSQNLVQRYHVDGDLFTAFEEDGDPFPSRGILCEATFLIEFTDTKTPRTVTINIYNEARYTRDEDAFLVERWLSLRGFIRPGREPGYVAA